MNNTVKCVLLFAFLLQSSKCTRRAMDGFVVGGNYTSIRQYPHSVFLDAVCRSNWTCGAAILNQRILITAAHCVYGCKIKQNHRHRLEASVGSGSLKKVEIKRRVIHFEIHQHYNEKEVTNDIALALLNKGIPFGKNIKRVLIQKKFPEVYYGNVAGWGTIDMDTGATSVFLKHVSQKLRSQYTCTKLGKLSPGMFCAGSEVYHEDHPAAGDSGSALVTRDFIQIGLVSFHLMLYPALVVYTNVTFYYPWVIEHARRLYCNTRK